MQHPLKGFIPIATTVAGSCLTPANWQEVGSTHLAYCMESLLCKPGLDTLQRIASLNDYLNWSGAIILNAKTLKANKEGLYVITSPFDGGKQQITPVALFELIRQLKPFAVLLPQNILQEPLDLWAHWPDEVQPFIHVADLEHHDIKRSHGVYFDVQQSSTYEAVLDEIDKWTHVPRYCTGVRSLDLIRLLHDKGVALIESDEPAKAAMQGIVSSQSGPVDLKNSVNQMQFEPIDLSCKCPTCAQKLTKAYLHHLLEHTPLLCQRFLIQHNVSFSFTF